MNIDLSGKRVLVTGGTGSLGKALIRRLLSGAVGDIERIVVFSRDEAKQHELRLEYQHRRVATDEVIFRNFTERLAFRIGDVRDLASVRSALSGIDIVFNAAALKQVPTCEYFPLEAVMTNIIGASNIATAIEQHGLPVDAVVGISTDKAVSPVNVMGMTKAIQERLFARANLDVASTRFVLARYGNVMASRGSVVPLFHDQIRNGGPVTITDERMTRFLLSLEDAVDVILAAVATGHPGETFIPRVPAALVTDIARVLIGDRDIEVLTTGVRPGEKLHESLISAEEGRRTVQRGNYYVIAPILPELRRTGVEEGPLFGNEYRSDQDVMSRDALAALFGSNGLLEVEDAGGREILA